MAARVWQMCDGKTTVAEMVVRLGKESEIPVDQAVWTILFRLEKAGLLQNGHPSSMSRSAISRRDLMRKIGAATLTLPFITSVLVPLPAEAASPCRHNLPPCPQGTVPCRSNLCVAGCWFGGLGER